MNPVLVKEPALDTYILKKINCKNSGGFRVVPRVPWNPSFMKVLIILYYDKLTRSVGPVDYNSPNVTPYLMSSKIILTVAHLQVLWSEFWSPRAQQTTQNTPFSIASGCDQCKSGRGQKIARAKRAFFMLKTPLYKILNPPLKKYEIAMK